MNLSILESDLLEKVESLQAELLEQCRLNGMGAEREAKLIGEVERLKTQLSGQTCYVPPEFQAEMDALRAEVERLKSEVVHWKSNHDNRVEAARVLIERDDLPLERVSAYKHYVELQAKCAELERERDEYGNALHDLWNAADDGDGSAYGTLSTTFVRDICKSALEIKK